MRWRTLLAENAPAAQAEMFKESWDANLDQGREPLPGTDTQPGTAHALRTDQAAVPHIVRVGFRSFDRQWIIADSRIMDRPRRDLWAARIPDQVFAVEQHSYGIDHGPGIVMSSLIPDFHHFNNRGGRVLPYLCPDGTANFAPGLTTALSTALGREVTSSHLLAYIAAVAAHTAYTATFADELTTPGIRIPVSNNAALWSEAVNLGEEIIWLNTYGTAFTGSSRPEGNVRLASGDPRRLLCTKPITILPAVMSYDDDRCTLIIGDGEFSPVSRNAWEYSVGGMNVLRSWFNYRKKDPGGKKTSPLDYLRPAAWDPDWTTEAIDLLTILTRLTALEAGQGDLLERILRSKLLTYEDLGARGVRWPLVAKDRKPRYSYDSLGVRQTPAGQAVLEI